ncbi:MAG: cytochrome c [Terriglobales bacterium]
MRSFACWLTAVFAVMVIAQVTVAAQESKTTVKHAAAAQTSPASGKEMFMNYCASCHGKDAKGDGPAAASLKEAPADLTTLAKRNGGKYPVDKVTSILRGQATVVPHGDQEMPVWGPVFWRMSGGHEEVVQQRIANLNRYLESVQEK